MLVLSPSRTAPSSTGTPIRSSAKIRPAARPCTSPFCRPMRVAPRSRPRRIRSAASGRVYEPFWQEFHRAQDGCYGVVLQGGDLLQRVIDDVQSEATNAAEMKAAASGNPLILMQVQLVADLRKLEALYSQHQRGQHRLRDRLNAQRHAGCASCCGRSRPCRKSALPRR